MGETDLSLTSQALLFVYRMGEKESSNARLTQRQIMGGACVAVTLLMGLLFGIDVLELVKSPDHASARIRKIKEPFPVSADLQTVFEKGYSGGGVEETLDEGAQAKHKYVQRILMQVLILNEIESMADLGCGTLSWMEPVLQAYKKEDPKFRYLGLDIARQLITRHKQKYANNLEYDFQVFDSTTSVVPDHYELIFSRDLLQHLPLLSVVDTLEQVSKSNARMFLVHTYKTLTPHEHNKNIKVGEYYDINLMSDPFNLVDPLAVYDENTYQMSGGTLADRHLFLYSVDDLKKVDYVAMRQRAEALSSRR